MSFITRNAVPAILIGIVVLAGVWYVFSDSTGDDALLSTEVVAEEAEVERSILDTLLALRAVSLSGTIFSDPAFAVLRDFGTQIVQEPVGRPNPFAPRGAATTTP